MDEFGNESKAETNNDSELMKIAGTTPGVTRKAQKKTLIQIETMLEEKEKPLAVVAGQSLNQARKVTSGIAVATDRRLIYVGHYGTEEKQFSLDEIDTVVYSPDDKRFFGVLLHGSSERMAFSLTANEKNVVPKFVETLRNAINDFQEISKSPQASISDDSLDKLKKLGDLRDSAVLSEEEFESKKAELLGNRPLQEEATKKKENEEKLAERQKKSVSEAEEKITQKGCLVVVLLIFAIVGGCVLLMSGGGDGSSSNDYDERLARCYFSEERSGYDFAGGGSRDHAAMSVCLNRVKK